MHSFGELPEIIQTGGPLAARFDPVQEGQQQSRQNAYDCHNNQEFDDGEPLCTVGSCFHPALDSAGRSESRRRTRN